MSDQIRMLALAAELEKEGQYNAAKLLRAASASLSNRASTALAVPSDPVAQADELEQLSSELSGTSAAALAGPLQAAAGALRAGGVPLIHETPDPHVCRICGETLTHPFGDRCRHCGRWPNTVEQHRPIYWIRASTPVESLALLSATPETVVRILEEGVANYPGPDGGWTAHQTLEHLHNAQSVFRGRIDQLLAGGDPELTSVMVWTMESGDVTTGELLDAYLQLRTEIVDVLSAADPMTWWSRGSHEEFGVVTLAEQASYFANHEPTHLAQLADAANPNRSAPEPG